ncbi:MAG: pseudouridine-5'-phosphate glycosidase [Chloroflexi bacterium]|nr:pseudouridine-5'-phosphate glycosidase [Chloroflexota bacterium]
MVSVRQSDEVAAALSTGQPVVALESTVISHGLPWPQNLELAQELETIVRDQGAIPATIAIIAGQPCAGLSSDEIEQLARGDQPVRKVSRRDFGAVIANREYGATTVAATMLVAHRVGIKVFATGGIGGVHRGDAGDISADLPELSHTPVAVVCAGAKSILDLPRTLEWLETYGVPVLGYGTSEFPAFYTRSSGLSLTDRVDTPSAAAAGIQAHWDFGLLSGVLVTVPIAEADAPDSASIDAYTTQALQEATEQGITGKDITPFLLERLVDLSGGETLRANLALLRQNAAVAAQIAAALQS